MGKKVSVIIPAYNEEGRIGETVKASFKISGVEEVIVVDDGSTDNTYNEAVLAGAKVIKLSQNVGKGKAIEAGAREFTGDFVLLLDGDLGNSAVYAEKLLTPLFTGEADMVIARFGAPRKKGGFGLVKRLTRWGLKSFTGQVVEAVLSGQRAFTRESFLGLLPLAEGYALEFGMTVDALKKGYRIVEVAVPMTHRETGRDLKGFIHRGRQFADILKEIIRRKVGSK
ncbi:MULTISPECIES: glycosyltransferase family 2 protein [Carboxydothermus]|uniref:Glucosyl-3-phosphoglycerate synthase n=2 Tax=Carboxydothermus TaxID=129957 RepID=Q3AAP0_CARHZ|nr:MULTISPECIES: glycosyltransferase family 2 protein [Carboxydothermus]ABB14130.1 glycosyltransferase, group 2 family [Carboxydothermus hydrogenoformans Z-2901]NYE58688.1 glycosyltransferase involved in cell wall biosynthesis [Carboxydothermus ferrireducens DSM 11255]